MDHKTTAFSNTITSILSATLGIITIDIQGFISMTAGIVAIGSGCMAIRHYHYATKKLKKEESRNEQDNFL